MSYQYKRLKISGNLEELNALAVSGWRVIDVYHSTDGTYVLLEKTTNKEKGKPYEQPK